MDLDISRPGLYYLLNTPAVQTRIRELGIESRVCFEKGDPDEIIRLVSRAVADVVQLELSTQLERLEAVDSEALKKPEWIDEVVKGMLNGDAIRSGSEQRFLVGGLPSGEPHQYRSASPYSCALLREGTES